jgi:serine protease AprX
MNTFTARPNARRAGLRPAFLATHLSLAAISVLGSPAFAAQVHPDLAAAASRGGQVEALIVLPEQATPALLPPAHGGYKAHRRALVDALRQRADVQQRSLRAWLDARGIDYRPFWIANLLHARLSAGDLAQLATRTDIARVEPNPAIAARLPLRAAAPAAPAADVAAIPWGVDKIKAPLVWAEGHTGAGVTIAGADTGYHWSHPALKPQYRGWNGSSADHNYHWHDAIHSPNGSCAANSPQPCDDNGHGTHTAGTFAGSDQGTQQIGVAPGAKWIGCRNMNAGFGTPSSYIECMQWMLAPTDLRGKNPDPDLAPDIVSNSWTCPASEGCTVGNELNAAVTQLTSAGILFVAAASNAGPACGSIGDPPATYAATFTIGATDSADTLADFSARGPVKRPLAGSRQVKPDVSAPGVDVYSAWPPTGYTFLNGTSMATPHVAGAAALLMSAVPALKGHPQVVARLLRDTAVTDGVANPVKQSCGGTRRSDWPNNMVGHGRIDVFAAYQAALSAAADLPVEP